jgi:hypothetical protein
MLEALNYFVMQKPRFCGLVLTVCILLGWRCAARARQAIVQTMLKRAVAKAHHRRDLR